MKTENLEMAIDLCMEMVYKDVQNGISDLKVVEALESLIRSWSTLQTTMEAKEVAGRVRSITNKSPELPFEFPTHSDKVRVL